MMYNKISILYQERLHLNVLTEAWGDLVEVDDQCLRRDGDV